MDTNNTYRKYKYPKTSHLPWSEGTTSDDRILKSLDHFKNMEVVVTEKRDGENTTISSTYTHARSLDSKHHLSREWVKNLWGEKKHDIPEGWRICGENLYAKHSIEYTELDTFFEVFMIFNETNTALSWNDTVDWCNLIGFKTVPILWTGVFNEDIIKTLWDQKTEGYVVRNVEAFHFDAFSKNVAKFVRKNHIQTDEHWTKNWTPNKLRNT